MNIMSTHFLYLKNKIFGSKRNNILVLSLIFFLSSSFTIRLIASPFTAPATLDPTCAPSSADCYVVTSTFSTGLTSTSGVVTSNLSTGVSGGQSVVGGTASGNNLTLSSTSNATKGKIVFGTSAYDEVNNYLGIGTAVPTNLLSLGGTSARTIWMERNTTAATAGQGLTLSSGGAIAGTADLAGGDLNLKSGISTGTGTSAMRFFTAINGLTGAVDNSPTEKMAILGNGNVGIGLTTPTTLFEVTQPTTGPGTVSVDTLGAVTGEGTQFLTTFKELDSITIAGTTRAISTITNDTLMYVNASVTSYSNVAYTLTGGNRFAVLGNGRVGIGTATPTADFELTNGNNSTIQKIYNTNSSGYAGLRLYNDTNANFLALNYYGSASSGELGEIATVGNYPLTIGTNNVERIRISNGGNVTIGTSTFGNVGIGSNTKLSKFTVTAPTDITDAGGFTTANDGTTITTTSALYLTRAVIGVGDRISLSPSAPGTYATITAIGSETSLTVDTALSGSAGETYNVKKSIFRLDDASNVTKFIVNDLGNVGIGVVNPSVPLEVKGTVTHATIAKFVDATDTTGCTFDTVGVLACSSDERLKKNIQNINYGLDTVMNMRPVLYNWKYENEGTPRTLGFIAQEVESVVPKLVSTDEKGFKSLNTIGMMPILAKAIQELNLKVQNISGLSTGGGSVADQFVGAILNIKELIVEKLTIGSSAKPTAITVYDKNGNAGCMTVEDVNSGATKIIPGVCTDTPTPSESPSPVTESIHDVVVSEPVPDPIIEPTPEPDLIVPEIPVEPVIVEPTI